MRIRESELQALAHAIVDTLLKQGFMRPRQDAAILHQRIAALIGGNLQEEAALEREAERLAESHARKMAGMDQRKIIQGIMERLARERDFAL